MKQLLFALAILVQLNLTAQPPLEFTEFGSEPAYCRLFGYQSGNGQVYCSATGGVPDYSYEWRNLETGETITSSTWGGLNPGCYEATVTDEMGTTLVDTLCIDSLNPMASIDVVSDDLTPVVWGHTGIAVATAEFYNSSMYFANPLVPDTDTIFYFRRVGTEPFEFFNNYGYLGSYTYEYNGLYTATLVAQNKNGCRDTTHATIGIFGPLGMEEPDLMSTFQFTTHSITQEIALKITNFQNEYKLNIYTTNGQKVHEQSITQELTTFNFVEANGVYLFELIDPISKTQVHTGKFTF